MDLLKKVEEDHRFDWVRAYETLGEHPALRGIIIAVFVIGALASILYFLRDYPHYLTLIAHKKVGLLWIKKLSFPLLFRG